MKKFVVTSILAIAASAASAQSVQGVNPNGFYDLSGAFFEAGGGIASPAETTYGVYTGVATPAGNLGLLEPSAPPVRDDIVTYDNLAEPINDYVTAAGGVQRSVNETLVNNGGGNYTLVITVTGTSPTGGPGDLWPSGFSLNVGGVPTPATSGGFGIGLGLPAALGGADPLSWNPQPNAVISGSIRIATAGVFGAPINLPLSLFPPNAANWSGVLGLSFGNGATGTAIQDAIELTLSVTKVPEPSALGLLALGGLALLRRR